MPLLRGHSAFSFTFIFFLNTSPSFLSVGENFTFSNACAVRTKHGTNKLLNKNCAKENGLLAKRIRTWEIICSFQVPLCCLGLNPKYHRNLSDVVIKTVVVIENHVVLNDCQGAKWNLKNWWHVYVVTFAKITRAVFGCLVVAAHDFSSESSCQ